MATLLKPSGMIPTPNVLTTDVIMSATAADVWQISTATEFADRLLSGALQTASAPSVFNGSGTFSGGVILATTRNISTDSASSRMAISGDVSNILGAGILLYGSNHATVPNQFSFRQTGVDVLTIDSAGLATFTGNIYLTGTNQQLRLIDASNVAEWGVRTNAASFQIRDITNVRNVFVIDQNAATNSIKILDGGATTFSGPSATFAGEVLVNDNVRLAIDIYQQATDRQFTIASGTGSSSGGNLQMGGSTNANVNRIRFRQNATVVFAINNGGGTTISNLAGTGSRTVVASAAGLLSAPSSDENLKDIVGKLDQGLDYVLAASKCTIEFNFKNKDMNAEGYNHWGFGARAVVKEYGKNPAFREHMGEYAWDERQMIAPVYNAIAELKEEIETLKKQING